MISVKLHTQGRIQTMGERSHCLSVGLALGVPEVGEVSNEAAPEEGHEVILGDGLLALELEPSRPSEPCWPALPRTCGTANCTQCG